MSDLGEHEQLLADIAEHPRSEVIEALADAMHSIEDDDGNGRHVDYYRSLAYATVEILPALFYDEDALCDEPGCSAHPERAVFTIPAEQDEITRLRGHSVTLNSVGWLMAVALGDATEDVERVEGDPVEQVTRLIAQRDAARRDLAETTTLNSVVTRLIAHLAAATATLQRIRELCDEAEYVVLADNEPPGLPPVLAVAVSDLIAVLPTAGDDPAATGGETG